MSELFRNVLNASLQGGIAIAVVLLLRLVLKKAPKRLTCMLWILVGLRLLVPFSIESELSLQPVSEPITRETWEQRQDYGRDPIGQVGLVSPVQEEPATAEMPEPLDDVQGNTDGEIVTDTEPPAGYHLNWTDILPYLWLVPAVGLAVYSLISYLVLKRRVREAVRLEDSIWESDRIGTAFILGYAAPRIYLPMGLSEENRKLILEHERTHLKRGDHWVKLIGFIALAVHWFNPLVWAAYILLCRDIEMACDERVVQNMNLEERKAYSAALLQCSSGHRSIAACPVAFGEVSVKQRILSVLNYRRPRFWLTLAALAAVIFVAVCFLTDPKGNDWETECRAVLEKIQSSDGYHIRVEGEFEGEIILDDWNESEYWKYGENILLIVKNQDSGMLDGVWYDGVHGAMRLGGDYYEGVSAYQQMRWQKENVSEEIPDPWLYTFDMDAQDVEAVSRKETDEGYEIRLMIYGPWDFESIKCDEYYVDFCFDHEGNFRYLIRYIYGYGELMGETLSQSIISTMYAYEATEADLLNAVKSYAGNLEQELDSHLGTAANADAGLKDPDEPGWGISLSVSNVTSTGLTLSITQAGVIPPQDLFYGQYYSLERFNGGSWEAVEPVIDNGTFTTEAILLRKEHTTNLDINWEWLYGRLPAGTYRIGKSISNDVAYQIGEDISVEDQLVKETDYTYYVCFQIGGAAVPETDLLDKCREALESFQQQENYHVSVHTASPTGNYAEYQIWQAGDNWLSTSKVNGDTDQTSWMKKDGSCYARHPNGLNGGKLSDWYGGFTLENEKDQMPWLRVFDWDSAEIRVTGQGTQGEIETITHRTGPFETVTCIVTGPFEVYRKTVYAGILTFTFDSEDALAAVELVGVYDEAVLDGEEAVSEARILMYEKEMTQVSTHLLSNNREEIAAAIDMAYAEVPEAEREKAAAIE